MVVQELRRDGIDYLLNQALLKSLDIAYIRIDVETYVWTLAQLLGIVARSINASSGGEQSAELLSVYQHQMRSFAAILNGTLPLQSESCAWYMSADEVSAQISCLHHQIQIESFADEYDSRAVVASVEHSMRF